MPSARGRWRWTVAGDLRLNGNNLTVSNLSSVAIQTHLRTQLPTIQNTGTNAATLTVGTDNILYRISTAIFTNGGTGSLGLTKVGTGTLTLKGASTNTGTVAVNGGRLVLSGSGSFGAAALIFIASGADIDLSAAAGNVMTLNSGQKLKGNGTISGGNFVSSSGSIVEPGDAIGTLNVSGGSVTLGGTLLIGLNRTNTPSNCDKLTASGTITYGGTLVVTNEGPALQQNDVFQLFSGATAGFSAFNLQTNDRREQCGLYLDQHHCFQWKNHRGECHQYGEHQSAKYPILCYWRQHVESGMAGEFGLDIVDQQRGFDGDQPMVPVSQLGQLDQCEHSDESVEDQCVLQDAVSLSVICCSLRQLGCWRVWNR